MGRPAGITHLASALLIALVTTAHAAETPPKTPIDGIEDNSFLIEEAYNQEPGVVQHIFNAIYVNDPKNRGWTFSFTQEWPVFGQEHQLSYTIPSSALRQEGERVRGIGDILDRKSVV